MAVILLLIPAIFLVLRRRNISGDVIGEMEDQTLVCGVNEIMPTHCVTENGMLYGKNHTICYMDFADKTEYVLCDEVNCTHLTSKCSSHYSDDMNGLALYRGNVYLFDLNDDGSAYEFIRMDTAGNHRKVLAKIGVGSFDVGEWYLLSVSSVYYCGDSAWAELNYNYMEENGETQNQIQCIRISLDNGDITELTSLRETGVRCEYEGISEEQILIRKSWKDAEKQAEMEAYYACGTEEAEPVLLEEGACPVVYNEDGTVKGIFSRYIFSGWYENGFLSKEMQWELPNAEQDTTLWIWDTKKNEKRQLCTVERGASIAFGESGMANPVFDGENMLFVLYKGGGMIDVAKVNLSDGGITPLFEDTENVTFRILGQTKDAFVGKVYDLENNSGTVRVYAVKKADYFKGNFDDMELLQTIREKWY